MNDADALSLKNPCQVPCRAEHREIAAWKNHGIDSQGAALVRQFPVVKQDEQHLYILLKEPSDHRDYVTLHAPEELADRANRNALNASAQ
jgi:hypothetical protein